MNRKTLLSLIPAFGLALALTGANPAPAVCVPGAMDTCESNFTKDHGDGDTTTCSLKNTIPKVIENADGSTTITADCDYGIRCGVHPARH
jgi:hypothetical protein